MLFSFLFAALSFASVPEATQDDLRGMAHLNCSGALVEFNRPDSARAVILTNGHCVRDKMLVGKEYVVDGAYDRQPIVVGVTDAFVATPVTRVIYGTAYGTDLGLIEVEQSYAELKKLGAKVFRISDKAPRAGTLVKLITAMWWEKQTCKITRIVSKIIEDQWIWQNSFALDSNCKLQSGYSGAPLFDAVSGLIVGVANSGNVDGKLCENMNPCEVNAFGDRSVHQGIGYAQRVSEVPACVSSQGELDLTLPGCRLQGAQPRR
jgi:hypothetical protein